jgi:CubicO group peptidase (beta-lactamase class C family)
VACCILIAAFAIDLGAAAMAYGPEYVWRAIVWHRQSPHDDARFSARNISASSRPVYFPTDPTGAALVRATFAHLAPAELRPGETVEQFLARTQTTSLLVLRGGRLLYEGYFNGHQRDTVQGSFSMAKSVISLLIGIAIAEHKLPSIDAPAEDLLPDVKGLHNSGISLRDLSDMTASFVTHKGHLWWPFNVWDDYKLMDFAPDLRTVADAVQPEYLPSTHFEYDGRNAMLLGMMLERRMHEHVARLLKQRLWHPMGAEFPASWSLDSRASGFEKMETGVNARPIDFLKIGQLVLRSGVAESGERLVPESWIEQIIMPSRHVAGWAFEKDRFYTLLWWGFTRTGESPDVFAEGNFGQVMLVSRANDVVLLRTGNSEGGVPSWPQLLRGLASGLGPATHDMR